MSIREPRSFRKSPIQCTGIAILVSEPSLWPLQDIEKAVERCMEMPEREVVLWGKVYASYSQVALAFGLNGSVVLQRMREGNELEDVVKEALSKEPITLMGRPIKTLWIFALLTKSSQAMRMSVYGMACP